MSILALTSDTLIGTPATGNIEYNGQFFGTDSNASRAQMQRIVQATAVASTSGTSITFSSLPAWIKKITVMLGGVSSSGTSQYLIQIGTGGTATTTGYVSASGRVASGATAYTTYTAGYGWNSQSAAEVNSGHIVLTNVSGNIWVASHVGNSTTVVLSGGGILTLGGVLDLVRLTTVGGVNTFDAGSINILYEG